MLLSTQTSVTIILTTGVHVFSATAMKNTDILGTGTVTKELVVGVNDITILLEQNQVDTDITIGWENPEESGVDGTVPAFGSVNSFPYKNIGYDDTYGVYRAVGADGKTYTSTDMLTWNNNTPDVGATAAANMWTFGFIGGKFCYSGYSAGTPKYFDGTNWQSISTTANNIVFFKGYWYAVSPFYLKRSNVIESGYTDVLPGTTFIDGCFAFDDDILSYMATPSNYCKVSIDGTNFASVPGEHIQAISNNGKYYLFDQAARVYESVNWDSGYTIIRDGYANTHVSTEPIKVNNVLYHLETQGTTVLVVSFDGTTWTEHPLPSDFSSADEYTYLKYLNNKIVVYNNTSHKICWADMSS